MTSFKIDHVLSNEINYHELYRAGFCIQFCYLSKRALKNFTRNKMLFWQRMMVNVYIAIITDFLYYRFTDDPYDK